MTRAPSQEYLELLFKELDLSGLVDAKMKRLIARLVNRNFHTIITENIFGTNSMKKETPATDTNIENSLSHLNEHPYVKSVSFVKMSLIGTIIGIIFGGLICISGVVITILGFSGSIEWIFEATNLKSRLTNASPGVFFALLGMIILWRYKPEYYEKEDALMKLDEITKTSITSQQIYRADGGGGLPQSMDKKHTENKKSKKLDSD